MNISMLNQCLSSGYIDNPEVFPHFSRLSNQPYVFTVDFGLGTLPVEPGILMIRGPRQYGKSTWLEEQIYHSIREFGAGSAYYLNGDNIASENSLQTALSELLQAFAKDVAVRRIFIDEITAVPQWEVALKRMADAGELADVLLITTGSKATDLRRGFEKLPGRKGKLDRTSYLFTPISYKEYKRVCGGALGDKTLISYLLSGGSPIAGAELAISGRIPEYVIELVRDWVDGEIAESGRSRAALLNILSVIFRFAGTPVGQAKLARESGLANNTVAAGYIEVLNDLGCVVPAFPWDQHREIKILRKPCKYQVTNLLSAVAYHSEQIRTVEDFLALPENQQGCWYEWLVAQELQRRASIQGDELLAPLAFWQNKQHEIDYVLNGNELIEVKRGQSSALEFSWFGKQFPQAKLKVLNQKTFATDKVQGVTIEDFLLEQ